MSSGPLPPLPGLREKSLKASCLEPPPWASRRRAQSPPCPVHQPQGYLASRRPFGHRGVAPKGPQTSSPGLEASCPEVPPRPVPWPQDVEHRGESSPRHPASRRRDPRRLPSPSTDIVASSPEVPPLGVLPQGPPGLKASSPEAPCHTPRPRGVFPRGPHPPPPSLDVSCPEALTPHPRPRGVFP
ncbi:hypothetical protein KY285_000789 [Solanum tuberosum]|nr:hypothetical protein KY285_000789 [Solanum tuberosum]